MRYKRIVLLLIVVVLLCGCGSPEKEGINVNETVDSFDKSLSELWTDFHENMTQDKNPEDDFRNSGFIAELKNYLSGKEAFEISEESLSDKIGITDVSIIEKSCNDWNARLIYVGADLYNKAVTDVSVKNKYVFLQISNGSEYYFKTVCDGDFAYPQDMIFFDYSGRYFAVIMSKYCSAYPEGILIESYTFDENGITPSNLFETYELEGISENAKEAGILFESSYEAGTSFGDIVKISGYADAETNNITLASGENKFTLRFNGEKYVLDRSE